MRLSLTLATVAATIGLAVAVPALADPPPAPVPDDPAADSAFLDSLNKAGMTYRSGADAVAAGRMACNMMISGRSEKDVVDELSMRNPGLNGGGCIEHLLSGLLEQVEPAHHPAAYPRSWSQATRSVRNACSPAWTRTRNPSVNSRMLCQLSYGGLPRSARLVGADRGMTLAYWRF